MNSAGNSGTIVPHRATPALWLVGASDKANLLGAALCGLSSWGPGAQSEPQGLAHLGDLEELLQGRSTRGTLILDHGQVPVEDIGFVRRFLDRNADWRLLVVGTERSDDCAERLLGLTRSEWLSWPPNLDQLQGLLPARTPGAAARASSPAPAPKAQVASIRPDPSAVAASVTPEPASAAAQEPAQAAAPQGLDLGKLFKELLINEHLAGHKWALEFQETLHLPVDERLAKRSFGAFINLARACAGREGLVRAQLERSGLDGDPSDTVCLQLSFPKGDLSPEQEGSVLARPIQAEGKLGSASKAALIAAEALRKRGGRVQMAARDGETMQLNMHLSSADLEALELERMEAESSTQPAVARAQDPFA